MRQQSAKKPASTRKKMLIAALIGAPAAVFVTVIVLNFTGGEQRIERNPVHRYGIDDAQFQRELGTLLGLAYRSTCSLTGLAARRWTNA